jgi:uncharacterized protein DUF4153
VADVTPSHAGGLSAGAPLPAWASAKVRFNAAPIAVVAVSVVGLAADQALRTGAFGLAATGTLLLAAAVLIRASRLQRLESLLPIGVAALFAAWLSVRASPWLLWPDLLAAISLLGLAASLAVRGSLFDLGVSELAARVLQAFIQAAAGAGYALRPALHARRRVRTAAPIARGLLIAVPIAAVVAALLASADPVFASFFNLNVDFGRLVEDVAFVVFGALFAAALLRLAASLPVERIDGPQWRLGTTEALVVLAVLDAVFAAFAIAQVLAATGAAADTLRGAGVTYADYARSGFFQLLWVSGITLVVLFLFSRISRLTEPRSRLAFMVLGQFAIALTLMIDVVAFRRLSLYEEAYGFTMLRLYSHVFAGWVALVFLLLAADFFGFWRRRRWFIGATSVVALGVLLALNIVNPEAMVVAFNTSHAQSTHKLDGAYLAELSSDATPALLESRRSIDASLGSQVDAAACSGARDYSPPVAAFNWSDAKAAAARRADC